jgi:putative transposase
MPRGARIVVPGFAHHIVQRGNNRQDVFFSDDDRRFFLAMLTRQVRKHGVRITAYCLMTNHFHLIAIPDTKGALSRALGSTNLIYAQYVNRTHERCGHLWQDRFYSCPMDGSHDLAASRYVERNPVRAGMIERAWDYPWSSAATHCRSSFDPSAVELLDAPPWRAHMPADQWRDILGAPDDPHFTPIVRRRTTSGLPLGGDRFVAKLEGMFNRSLRPKRRGRPRKAGAEALRSSS